MGDEAKEAPAPAPDPDDDDEEGEEGPEPEPEPTPEELGDALLQACKDGDSGETSRLVLGQAPLQHEDTGGWTPLLWASCNGHSECVASLIAAGAAVPYLADATPAPAEDANGTPAVRPRAGKPQKVVNSPIHWAAFKGNLEIVWKLLHANVSHEHVDGQGNTALHLAASGGHVSVVLCLLNHGADLLARNFFCNTCMDLGRERADLKAALKILMAEKTYNIEELPPKSAKSAGSNGSLPPWVQIPAQFGLKLRQDAFAGTRVTLGLAT
jgi:ankyrin repeat protein